MKKLALALTAVMASGGSVFAADLPPRAYTKAPVIESAPSWTGFYVFGGAGGGLWDAKSDGVLAFTSPIPPFLFRAPLRDQTLGGDGWFGTVGLGYDWQFDRSWVVGVFADGQFGSLRGSLTDTGFSLSGSETLRNSYAAGVRFGYLVAPNVFSYVNAGYSGSQWSGSTLSNAGQTVAGAPVALMSTATPSFNRNGWFIGGGVENSLNIFGISASGWFMKTEYRAAYYNRVTLPETQFAQLPFTFNDTVSLKPSVQTISTSLVYRFNPGGPVLADVSAPRTFTKAPVREAAPNWTGFYIFGGAGGGIWDAKSAASQTLQDPEIGDTLFTFPEQKSGGDGWFGTVGLGYDWQFNRSWVVGIFTDGQFGSIRGSLIDGAASEGEETLRNSYAAGARFGYLVAPNVLSYVDAGYSGSQWSGTALAGPGLGAPVLTTTPSFNRNGWFLGGGVENDLNIFGISAPGWFMKTEYRAAYYNRVTLSEAPFSLAGVTFNDTVTFKPLVQTVSTSLVYRFK